MNTIAPQLTPVNEYARRLLALHELDLQGRQNGEDADIIRDGMDAPWYAMTPQEHERMGGLSEDLYALADGGPPRVAMSETELQAWRQELQESKARYLHGDIDAWLAFLRKPRPNNSPPPDGIPASTIHFFQAQCWEKLNDYETAALFKKAAEGLMMELATASADA